MNAELLSATTVRERYGVGREVARQMCRVLPHVKIGKKGRGEQVRVLRRHVDALLGYVAMHRLDLAAVLAGSTSGELDSIVEGKV
ncbi:hypothetical protein [Deinococcus aestuarii]|uniref:hypothetical protein n=1 Tax=Deinococcus aestuarii TaxID=2774531 RepID=UPI001C0D866E|nr:hypothetical protein [Deinococcus aestuarii]